MSRFIQFFLKAKEKDTKKVQKKKPLNRLNEQKKEKNKLLLEKQFKKVGSKRESMNRETEKRIAERIKVPNKELHEPITQPKRKMESAKPECTQKENRIATMEGRLREVNDGRELRLSARMEESVKTNRETEKRITERIKVPSKELHEPITQPKRKIESVKAECTQKENRKATLEGRLRDVKDGMESRLSTLTEERTKTNRENTEKQSIGLIEPHNKEIKINSETKENVANLKNETQSVKIDSKLKDKQMSEVVQQMDQQKKEWIGEITNLNKKVTSVNEDFIDWMDKEKKETDEKVTNLKKEMELMKNRIATLEEEKIEMELRFSAMMEEKTRINMGTACATPLQSNSPTSLVEETFEDMNLTSSVQETKITQSDSLAGIVQI